jgi:hypothetical protein
LLGHGTNYITARAIDYALSTTTVQDAFKILKDTQAPSQISDLAALPGPIGGSVSLTWTAPGDDGVLNNNTMGSYIIKYSTSEITSDALFDSATTYVQTWVPANAAIEESKVLYGLTSGITYYFAVKTKDKGNNTSVLSNQASSLPQTNSVYINEVYPSGASAGEDWIELYNNTDSTFTLTGWELVYNQGTIDLPGNEILVWTGTAIDKSSVSASFLITPTLDRRFL